MNFKMGDKVICIPTGVVGTIIKFYTPTASCSQIMVQTSDGRKYHAPQHTWALIGIDVSQTKDISQKILNPYGEYLCKFAENHGVSIVEAAEQLMLKARHGYFCKTGC